MVGAILFGAGMQIGGGCASRTLFALGGGNARLLMPRAFFVVGSAVGAAHLGFWWRLPSWNSGTRQDWFGWPAALALHLAIFATVLRVIPAPARDRRTISLRLLLEPWLLAWGALGLAAMSAATLLLAGRPLRRLRRISTRRLGLLAGERRTGVHERVWRYHIGDGFRHRRGRRAGGGPRRPLSSAIRGNARAWLGAAAGGFLMRYGARLSDGGKIGAYF